MPSKKTLLDRIAYHISPKKFSQFKILPRSGMGTNFYGPGVYLAYGEGTIDSFERQLQEYYDKLYRYKVAISPDAKIIDEEDLINYLPSDISEDSIPQELMSRGVDGMNYFNDEDGNSVVIYNPDVLRILR